MPQKVIAIDGPSASGKGTVAQRVADALGWRYLDSGALYRITALYARNRQIAWDNEAAVAALAQALPVEFVEGAVLLDGEDVSAAIRSEEIGMGASRVAALPAVRTALLQRQRAIWARWYSPMPCSRFSSLLRHRCVPNAVPNKSAYRLRARVSSAFWPISKHATKPTATAPLRRCKSCLKPICSTLRR